MRLQQNTKQALRQIATIKPEQLEAIQEQRKVIISEIDSLKRSQQFFKEEYAGADKETHLKAIEEVIIRQECVINSIPEIVTIGQMSRQNPDVLDDNIVLILNDLRLFFQVDHMITTEGLYALCPIICINFKSLSLEDIAICMNNAKLGHYGKLYNRLDGAIILGWLTEYQKEKMTRLDNRNYVREAHAKIGLNEGRSAGKDNSTLLREAQIIIGIGKLKR
ncbi:hypothetical protein [Sphingobacterium spiritivorum]|nr:hypothetical protein [Sphingobacterium spiritivorum]